MNVNQVSGKINIAHNELGAELQKKTLSSGNRGTQEDIKKLSEEFESIFLGIVLKSMRETVPKSGFVKSGNGEEIFRSMLDTEYAKSLASQRSTGLADSIETHLLGLAKQQTHNSPDLTNKTTGLNRYKIENP